MQKIINYSGFNDDDQVLIYSSLKLTLLVPLLERRKTYAELA